MANACFYLFYYVFHDLDHLGRRLVAFFIELKKKVSTFHSSKIRQNGYLCSISCSASSFQSSPKICWSDRPSFSPELGTTCDSRAVEIVVEDRESQSSDKYCYCLLDNMTTRLITIRYCFTRVNGFLVTRRQRIGTHISIDASLADLDTEEVACIPFKFVVLESFFPHLSQVLRVPAFVLIFSSARAIWIDVVKTQESDAVVLSLSLGFNSTDGISNFWNTETAAVSSKTGSAASTFGSTDSSSSGRN